MPKDYVRLGKAYDMNNFKPFAEAVAKQFKWMSAHELFVVDIAGDDIWQAYLAAFPPGTNEIYRVRTEHDGSYDRAFVRKLGNVVRLKDGRLTSIWDAPGLAYPYDQVAAVLAAKVRAAAITSVYRTKETTLGYESSIERLEGGATHRWYHFHATINHKHQAASPAEAIGQINTNIGVYKRAMTELKLSAFDDVLDLISNNALYRGEEHKANVSSLRSLYLNYATAVDKNRALWESFIGNPMSVTLLRNTVVGTLLIDLSEGVLLETAVRSFEQKVAPTNYRRPTALITQRMVDDAAATIATHGLESALDRRMATMADVSVNNVLWVDNSVQAKMKDGIAGLLAKDVTAKVVKDTKAKDISIDDFMSKVLPKVASMKILFANPLASNLVTLTAPVHADAEKLFKWNNSFAWSYTGNITDSIKERVKRAGGNVDAKFRVSLAWFNHDDLDIHVMRGSSYHVYFGNKIGVLDVDMNAGGGASRTPVENLSWNSLANGDYKVWVHQYAKRESVDIGFEIDVEGFGFKQQFKYSESMRTNQNVEVLTFRVEGGAVTSINIDNPKLVEGLISREEWGVKTETFVKVNTLLLSPNFWDDQAVGNKHWFFILDGCKTSEAPRGVYNEFLRNDLEQHRKVLEVLGNRTKCAVTDDQLSGLGFSSTQRNTLTVRVTGTGLQATYNIKF